MKDEERGGGELTSLMVPATGMINGHLGANVARREGVRSGGEAAAMGSYESYRESKFLPDKSCVWLPERLESRAAFRRWLDVSISFVRSKCYD